MNIADIRGMADLQLAELEMGLLRESFNLKMQKATGQLSKPTRIAQIRKDIARIKTVISEKGRKI